MVIMKEIPLTQGKVTIVDDADIELLSSFHWYAGLNNGRWYVQARVRQGNGKYFTAKMHRIILGVEAGVLVDHIDGDGLNNTRANLRRATHRENARNSRKNKNSESGYKGTWLDARVGKWQASIRVNGQGKSLGYFDTPEAGARAYDVAAKAYFGEFARLNFPGEVSSDEETAKLLSQFHLGQNNSSGYRGVSWDSEFLQWRATVQVGGKRHCCGRFGEAIDAARAYDAALLKNGGDPMRLNFPTLDIANADMLAEEYGEYFLDQAWMNTGLS